MDRMIITAPIPDRDIKVMKNEISVSSPVFGLSAPEVPLVLSVPEVPVVLPVPGVPVVLPVPD